MGGFGLFAVGYEVEAVNGEGEFAALFAGFFVVPLVHFEGAFKDDWLAFGEVSGNDFGWFSEGGAFQKEGFFPFFAAGGFVFPAVGDAEVDHAFFVCEELGDGIAGEIPGDDEVVEGDAHLVPFKERLFFSITSNEKTTKPGFCSNDVTYVIQQNIVRPVNGLLFLFGSYS